jgi:hypothetical protein
MSPHETLFLESTNDVRIKDISTSALVQFQLLDFPGNFDFSDKKSKITPDKIFRRSAAVLVFVIDAQVTTRPLSQAIAFIADRCGTAALHCAG